MQIKIPQEYRPGIRSVLKLIEDEVRFRLKDEPDPENVFDLFGRLRAAMLKAEDQLSSSIPISIATSQTLVYFAGLIARGLAAVDHKSNIEQQRVSFDNWCKQVSLPVRRKVITLCGSTKFKDAYFYWNRKLSLDEDAVVISVTAFGHSGDAITPEQKEQLDQIHKHKIDLADEIFVLDQGGYIGDSTRSEILYATKEHKKVRYLSHEFPEYPNGKADEHQVGEAAK